MVKELLSSSQHTLTPSLLKASNVFSSLFLTNHFETRLGRNPFASATPINVAKPRLHRISALNSMPKNRLLGFMLELPRLSSVVLVRRQQRLLLGLVSEVGSASFPEISRPTRTSQLHVFA